MQNRRSTLLEGPVWKGMVLFAVPIFLGNLFQQFYNTFDSWCVGNFIGEDALAAVSSSGSLIFMMVGFFSGVAMGAGVIMARYFGAGDTDSLKKAIHTDVALGLATGGLLTVLGVVFTPVVLGWMGTPEEVMPQSVSYFRYFFCGAIFTVMYNVFVGILHALGDSRTPLYYLILASFINVGLDLLFVAVLGLGVGAAAMATTISQGLSAVLCAIRLMRLKTDYRLQIKQIRFHKKSLQQIIRYGLPAGVQNSVIAFANVVVQSNINSFGKAAMAGCGSYSKIEGFAFLPITCFTQALATFVGQNLGAGNVKRVKKGVGFGILCPALIAELIGVTVFLLAPKLIGFFNDDPVVVDFGTRHMRTIAPFYFLLATTHCISSVLRGAGKTTLPMIVMLAVWCVFRVSYITVAVQYINRLETVSWAYPITWTISSIILVICFFKTDWLHHFERREEKQRA